MIKTVTVQELCEQLESDENSVLIDVRLEENFVQGHIPQARNIPLGTMPLAQMLAEWSREAEGKPIYFICQSGARSQQLVDELARHGYFAAQCVAGGMVAWQAMGLPLAGEFAEDTGRRPDRRARLVFGLVVVLGCFLGLAVHRGFFAIPLIAGLESVFTAITGWSGLGVFWGRGDDR